ncbi:MAG: S9 family peptidase [Sphingomonadales bacterium]|nr:S9 family peptidase [Sphingomonadales bacterium]
MQKGIRFFSTALLLFITLTTGFAQQGTGYKLPPTDVADMLLALRPANVSIDNKGEWMLLSETHSYAEMEDLAAPELKIAGLRINPRNAGPSRQALIHTLKLRNALTKKEYAIEGLPKPLKATSVSWSPNQQKISFLQMGQDRIDLYVINVAQQKAVKINRSAVNAVLNRYQWKDNSTLLYFICVQPAAAAPQRPAVPDGPAIQENSGKASPRPTFQDLIKSPHDEALFAFYAQTQLVSNAAGVEVKIGAPALYKSLSLSPDKKYFLQEIIVPPFSYTVPASGFASRVLISDANGKMIKELGQLPSAETAPGGNDNVQNVPRSFDWRDDEAATLTWCEPLDGGLIKNEATYRDAVYALAAPFTGDKKKLFATKMRYGGTTWGHEGLALVTEGLRSKQLTALNRFNPITEDLERILTRNSTNAYANPGNPLTRQNEYGKQVLWTLDKGNKILMVNNTGSSPKGDLPFLLSFDVHTKKADTLWRCKEGNFETIVKVIDAEKGVLITQRESEKEVPNYYRTRLSNPAGSEALTSFSDPYPAMRGVQKQKIVYKRADGITLTGELYLPKGYNASRDGKLPVLIWAYPAEYNSAADAAQIRGSEHRFTYLSGGSPVFYVTQGYAVLNNAEMPIVATAAEGKPNDNFIEQLTLNASAAINALDSMGVGDPTRVAVGGHSYGAFMTANLLAHTKLFKAGIARSGAYNRTLTPFGFQNEDRSYWEAPELYNRMSPFSYANQIKTPLLLIHGEMDNNTGTFPIQSERMFNAIKGHGGTARYVSLPYESHGYTGKENLLHVLAEQFEWLEKFVKNPVVPPGDKRGF